MNEGDFHTSLSSTSLLRHRGIDFPDFRQHVFFGKTVAHMLARLVNHFCSQLMIFHRCSDRPCQGLPRSFVN